MRRIISSPTDRRVVTQPLDLSVLTLVEQWKNEQAGSS